MALLTLALSDAGPVVSGGATYQYPPGALPPAPAPAPLPVTTQPVPSGVELFTGTKPVEYYAPPGAELPTVTPAPTCGGSLGCTPKPPAATPGVIYTALPAPVLKTAESMTPAPAFLARLQEVPWWVWLLLALLFLLVVSN